MLMQKHCKLTALLPHGLTGVGQPYLTCCVYVPVCVCVCVCVCLGMHVCRCLCRCVFVDDITLHICLQGHVWSRMCFSQDFCRAAHLHLPSPGSWSEGCISEVLPMLHNWHAESRPHWKFWCGASPAAQCDKEKLKKMWNFNSAWNTLNRAWWWMM